MSDSSLNHLRKHTCRDHQDRCQPSSHPSHDRIGSFFHSFRSHCLSSLRLLSLQEISSSVQLAYQLILMVNNAQMFNTPGHAVYHQAAQMRQHIREVMAELCEEEATSGGSGARRRSRALKGTVGPRSGAEPSSFNLSCLFILSFFAFLIVMSEQKPRICLCSCAT